MKAWLPSLFLLLLATRGFGSSVAITTKTLPNGTVGTAYTASISASGGCTPYKWSIASGSLPAGITAKPSSSTTSLTLSGTPTTASNVTFAVKVAGCGNRASQDSYTVVIQGSANHVVDLNWNASTSSDIAGYNVYRGPDGMSWQKINTGLVASTLYSDSSVANGSTYYYAATAVDTSGKESSKTAAVKAIVP